MGGRGQTSASGKVKKKWTQKELKEISDSLGGVKLMSNFSPSELYNLANTFTADKANVSNFFENSVGFWLLKKSAPKREPDYTSKNKRTGKVSSRYWYTKEGVYRESDHWGAEVASCSWFISGRSYSKTGVKLGKKEVAFISWDKLKAKGNIAKNSKGEYFLFGFTFEKIF